MKKSMLLASCLALLVVNICGAAQAHNATRDDQGAYSVNNPDSAVYEQSARKNANYVSYNNDATARNRGENNTGGNMGPAGRNSGFDENNALHGTSARHINDTAIDGRDNYRADDYNNRSR